MTREEWNIAWKQELAVGEKLKLEEPPSKPFEEWKRWIEQMIAHADRLSKLDAINKELLEKEFEDHILTTLQTAISKLFHVKS